MSGRPQAENWVVEHRPGDVLYRAGDAAACAYVVVDGEVELLAHDAVLARLGPGDVCGLLGLLQGTPQALAARVAKDARLLRLEAPDLGRAAGHPELGTLLLRALARQLEAALLPPVRAAAPAPGRPRLVAEDGHEFALPAAGSALVGRGDAASGHQPDLDLSALDTQRSLSRRHARLRREGQVWLVSAEPRAANGTFVNGERLAASREQPLREGDVLLFGNVRVTYRED